MTDIEVYPRSKKERDTLQSAALEALDEIKEKSQLKNKHYEAIFVSSSSDSFVGDQYSATLVSSRIRGVMNGFLWYVSNKDPEFTGFASFICSPGTKLYHGLNDPEYVKNLRESNEDFASQYPPEKDFGPPNGGRVFFKIKVDTGLNEDYAELLEDMLKGNGFKKYEPQK